MEAGGEAGPCRLEQSCNAADKVEQAFFSSMVRRYDGYGSHWLSISHLPLRR